MRKLPRNLEKFVLQSHVVLRLETDAGTEDVDQRTSLLSKSVDDWSPWWSQRSFEHVAENTKHAVKVLEIFGRNTVVGSSLPLDTSHHLGNQDEINDQRGGKKGILADIEETIIISRKTLLRCSRTYEIVW